MHKILLISTDWAYKSVPNVQKRVCNAYIFQPSFHFAHHRWWLGRRCWLGRLDTGWVVDARLQRSHPPPLLLIKKKNLAQEDCLLPWGEEREREREQNSPPHFTFSPGQLFSSTIISLLSAASLIHRATKGVSCKFSWKKEMSGSETRSRKKRERWKSSPKGLLFWYENFLEPPLPPSRPPDVVNRECRDVTGI